MDYWTHEIKVWLLELQAQKELLSYDLAEAAHNVLVVYQDSLPDPFTDSQKDELRPLILSTQEQLSLIEKMCDDFPEVAGTIKNSQKYLELLDVVESWNGMPPIEKCSEYERIMNFYVKHFPDHPWLKLMHKITEIEGVPVKKAMRDHWWKTHAKERSLVENACEMIGNLITLGIVSIFIGGIYSL